MDTDYRNMMSRNCTDRYLSIQCNRGRNSGCPAVRGLPEIRSDCRRWRQRQSDGHPPNSGIFLQFFYSQCRSSTTATTPIGSLPHSVGDSRNYRTFPRSAASKRTNLLHRNVSGQTNGSVRLLPVFSPPKTNKLYVI